MGDGHLSDNISIDPKIYVDNWGKLTTFGHSQGGKLKNKNNCLHDMIQNYSSGEILFNSTPVLLGLKTKQERNYETITLSTCVYLF